MSPKPKNDIFSMNEFSPSSGSAAPENAAVEVQVPDAAPQKSGSGMLGILVVAIIIVVAAVGGFLLYKFCVAEEPMASGKVAVTNKAESSKSNQSRPPTRSIESLEDIEIKSPEQWKAVLGGQDPVSVVACTMTGCGPCNQFKPALLAAAKKSKCPIHMLNFNGEDWKKGELSNMKVAGFPTMYRIAKGQPPQEYQGDRSEASIVRFAETGSG